LDLYEELSKPENGEMRRLVRERAEAEGMVFLADESGTNIDVQLFDTSRIKFDHTLFTKQKIEREFPVIIVMDYAFGEQAYETIDELLKPYKKETFLNVDSVSIKGKAGILTG